jgi:hypothetical protein
MFKMWNIKLIFNQFNLIHVVLQNISRYTLRFLLKVLKVEIYRHKTFPQCRVIEIAILIRVSYYEWKFLCCRLQAFQSWQFAAETTDDVLTVLHRRHSRQPWPTTSIYLRQRDEKLHGRSRRTMLLLLAPKQCSGRVRSISPLLLLHSSSWFLISFRSRWKFRCIGYLHQKSCPII